MFFYLYLQCPQPRRAKRVIEFGEKLFAEDLARRDDTYFSRDYIGCMPISKRLPRD